MALQTTINSDTHTYTYTTAISGLNISTMPRIFGHRMTFLMCTCAIHRWKPMQIIIGAAVPLKMHCAWTCVLFAHLYFWPIRILPVTWLMTTWHTLLSTSKPCLFPVQSRLLWWKCQRVLRVLSDLVIKQHNTSLFVSQCLQHLSLSLSAFHIQTFCSTFF